ncbi:hypothetical protein V1291_000031 [Nitrobacteraceae bacterium AZCC 1564]
MSKYVPPALAKESFSCPHSNCRAIAHQTWFQCYADTIGKNDEQPTLISASQVIPEAVEKIQDESERNRVKAFVSRLEDHIITYRNVKYSPNTTGQPVPFAML